MGYRKWDPTRDKRSPQGEGEEWSHDDSFAARIKGNQFRLEQFGRVVWRKCL